MTAQATAGTRQDDDVGTPPSPPTACVNLGDGIELGWGSKGGSKAG